MSKPEFDIHALIDLKGEHLLIATLKYIQSPAISVGEVRQGIMSEFIEKANILSQDSMVASFQADKSTCSLVAILTPMTGDSRSRSLAVQLKNRAKLFSNAMVDQLEAIDFSASVKKLEPFLPMLEKLAAGSSTSTSKIKDYYGRLVSAALYLKNPFVGKFDNAENGIAGGWLLNMLTPDERYEVHIMEGMRIVGYGNADLFREDLLQARKLDGRVAFRIQIPNSLYDGREHILTLRVKGKKAPLPAGVVRFKAPNRQQKRKILTQTVQWHLLELLLQHTKDETTWLVAFEIFQKALVDIDNGELTSADFHLQDLVEAGVDCLPIHIVFAQLALLRGRATQALELLNPLDRQGAITPIIQYLEAVAYQSDKKPLKALEMLEQALQKPAALFDCVQDAELLLDELSGVALSDASVDSGVLLKRLRKQLIKHPEKLEVSDRIGRLLQKSATDLFPGPTETPLGDHSQKILTNSRHQRMLMESLILLSRGELR